MGEELKPGVQIYQIVVAGKLDEDWSDWFGGLHIEPQSESRTVITGPVVDQAALHGLLNRIYDVGLALMSVHRLERPGWG